MVKRSSGSSWVAAGVALSALLVAGSGFCGAPAPNPVDVDPLAGVTFELAAGSVTGYFADVDGIGSESEVVEHRLADDKGFEIVTKAPGRLKFLDVTLKRGVTANLDLWAWRALVEAGDMKAARKNVTLIMYDQTFKSVAEWTFESAWPSRIAAPGITPGSEGPAVEELTLVHEGYARVR